MKKILKNAIRCKHCGDVIESTWEHDFKFCSCRSVAVDGGHVYLKRCFKDSEEDYEELSEWLDEGERTESSVELNVRCTS